MRHCNQAPTNLDEVVKHLLAGRTTVAAIHFVHPHVLFEQVQPLEGFGAQDAGEGAAVRVHQQVVFQGQVAHEALGANVAGEGVGIPTVHPQVLLQLVFVPEGLAAVGALERAEGLPYEKVLQRRILQLHKRVFRIRVGGKKNVCLAIL